MNATPFPPQKHIRAACWEWRKRQEIAAADCQTWAQQDREDRAHLQESPSSGHITHTAKERARKQGWAAQIPVCSQACTRAHNLSPAQHWQQLHVHLREQGGEGAEAALLPAPSSLCTLRCACRHHWPWSQARAPVQLFAAFPPPAASSLGSMEAAAAHMPWCAQ